MELHTKRLGVIGGFALMLLLLVGNLMITRHQLSSQVDSQRQSAHSRHVLLEITQVELLIRDAESGQRGYLYTGNPQYLAPYQYSVHAIQPHIDNLAQLVSGNPSQLAKVETLRKLAAQKINELDETISLYKSGKQDAARALVVSNTGFHLMDQIVTTSNSITDAEESLARSRLADYRQNVRRTIFSLYLASGIAALGLLFLALYILREMRFREQHAQQLLAREEWFRVTLTSLGDAVIATDNTGSVTYLNPLAEQLIGIRAHNAVGRHVDTVFPIFNELTNARVDNPIRKVIELGQIVGLANHTVLRSASGTMIPIEDSAAPIRDRNDKLIGVVLVFRDATSERKMQDLLRESEKLAAAARISAAVAHEINNPLESVNNLVFLAKSSPGVPHSVVEYLELAEQELERVSHIVKRTLGFYRESRTPEPIDLRELVVYVLKLLDNRLQSKNISVVTEFSQCPPVLAIAGEMKQAMSNLIANAADAVNECGRIWIRLFCVENGGMPSVRFEIEDDGPGVPSEHIDRIFEAFYTTKKDVGTGLGLWVTKGIVERYGGTIDLHPPARSATGAFFEVSLPAAPRPKSPAAPHAHSLSSETAV